MVSCYSTPRAVNGTEVNPFVHSDTTDSHCKRTKTALYNPYTSRSSTFALSFRSRPTGATHPRQSAQHNRTINHPVKCDRQWPVDMHASTRVHWRAVPARRSTAEDAPGTNREGSFPTSHQLDQAVTHPERPDANAHVPGIHAIGSPPLHVS